MNPLPRVFGRILLLFALVLSSALAHSAVPATTAGATVYVFWAEGCPHCEKALAFLARQQAADPDLRVHAFEVRRDPVQRARYLELSRHFGVARPGVPLIVIGDRHWVGYHDDALSGGLILNRIAECRQNSCPDIVAPPAGALANTPANTPAPPPQQVTLPDSFTLPLIGSVATRDLSLPAITVLLAAIDGFNPCAMWTLVFLIGLLIGQKDRFRMWFLGGLFIAGSALVYLLFLTSWLNALLALGGIDALGASVRRLIGAVALLGGAYYLKEYFANPEAACKVTAPAARRRMLDRLKATVFEPRLMIAAVGILALAFVVNLVELACSAGIPAIFTQILALHALTNWEYAAYLLLYILVFMLDDLIVFVVAMRTLQLAGIGSRYVRTTHLIGSVVLLALGLILIFRPEWLLFG